MRITIRLDDDIGSELARVAHATGLNRSEWIKSVIAKAILASDRANIPAPPPAQEALGERADHLIRIRLTSREVQAIATTAESRGLSVMAWLRHLVRWQLWDKASQLRMTPATHTALAAILIQLRKVGTNLNQTVKALHASRMVDSRLDLIRIAQSVTEMRDDILAAIEPIIVESRRAHGLEFTYWRSCADEARAASASCNVSPHP